MLSPYSNRLESLSRLAQLERARLASATATGLNTDAINIYLPYVVDWAEEYFFVAETRRPIALMPHQRDILTLFSERRDDGRFKWTTLIYSTIKKSGKTTVSGLYSRWAAQTWGNFQEVYNLGNKEEQAKGRAFAKVYQSIVLGGMTKDWEIQKTRMTHLPSGSKIDALPISDEGEAGSNPSLTVWTELWGFQYEKALRMWDEMQPVLTRPLSQRFVDTYAGYEGESHLLKELWDLGLSGERLIDDLPVYGMPSAGLIAYIDSGEEARRMPWQLGEEGKRYYERAQATERPHNYRRLHLNEWASSVNALVEMAVWDSLAIDPLPLLQRVVIGVDASVSGDCTAMVVVGYENNLLYEIETKIWSPPEGGKIDYALTLRPALVQAFGRWQVVEVAYDPYQLHDLITQLAKEFTAISFYEFNQGTERVQADTALVNHIRQGTMRHTGNPQLREHVQNADSKEVQGGEALRIIKREATRKIDAIVAMSQAMKRALEVLGAWSGKPIQQFKIKNLWWSKRS